MVDPQRQLAEIRELTVRCTDGAATPEQVRRLSQLLEDPHLAGDAAAVLDLEGALSDAMQYRKAIARSVFSLPWLEQYGWRLTAIAACLLISHIAVFAIGQKTSQDDSASGAAAGAQVVVRPANLQLVSTTACLWDPGEFGEPILGQSLDDGQVLSLLEGIAELEIRQKSGGKSAVRIEGPANVTVRGGGRLGLEFGSITADVFSAGEPFEFDVPNGRVIVGDSARIGVIAAGERDEVHVFEGRAKIRAKQIVLEPSIQTIESGQGARLLPGSLGELNYRPIDASRAAFATAISMGLDRLELDDQYRHAVLESRPSLYWSFSEESQDADNGVGDIGLQPREVGLVGSANYGDNSAVAFGSRSFPCAVLSDGLWPDEPLDDYSIEFWVKPNHYHCGAVLSLFGERTRNGQYGHGVLVEIGGPYNFGTLTPVGRLRYLHRNPVSTEPRVGNSCFADTPYRLRRWHHVVARKQAEEMSLFVNGALQATAQDPKPLPSNLHLLIGQLYPPEDLDSELSTLHRPFVGQVDEVALYDRALKDEEIVNHFELGRSLPTD